MRGHTVFDAASFTMVLAVLSSIGALWEEGKFDLDIPWATSGPKSPTTRSGP
ncbi:putative esterase [Streptomyces viridochromogenes Tue57]|uniref:Putative esterase n=1 Tax=Streptomyces viridochromogenes Tue57 TaxID=1160705 RepID=L8PEP7_STRVR|nr:putative esterase [Streptomyces viridochromogenes Tue57]